MQNTSQHYINNFSIIYNNAVFYCTEVIIDEYENQILEQVSSAKLFEIHIDSNLTWQDQYNYICKKISQNYWHLKTNQRLCEH